MHDKVVSACTQYPDAGWRLQARGIDVLVSEGEDGAGPIARHVRGSRLAKGGLGDRAPRARRLGFRFDDFGDQRERILVEVAYRLAVQWLAAEQDGLAQSEIVDPSGIRTAGCPVQVR